MSKMSNLSNVLDEMIQYGQGMIASAEELKRCGDGLIKVATEIKEAFSTEESAKATKPAKKSADLPKEETAPEEAPVEKTYSFTDVRGALAAKSKEGFKEEVKKLISKYGAEKLSDINPDDYAALMKDVEGLGNG